MVVAETVAEYHRLYYVLSNWLRGRSDVHAGYLTKRDGVREFLVVSNSSKLNQQLEDELTELDIWVANDPGLSGVNVNMMLVPLVSDKALAGFLDRNDTVVVR